jgi:hypothetical protein
MTISSTADFDWNGDDDAVVLREQPAVAVYQNPRGQIVIRQERAWDEDSDTVVLILPENVSAIVRALQSVAREISGEAVPPRQITDRHPKAGSDLRLPLEAAE